MRPSIPRTLLVALLTAGSLLAVPASSLARHGDDDGGGGGGGGGRGGATEVHSTGTCGRGAGAQLRLKTDDDGIESRFEVRGPRRGTWRIVIVQERRVAWRETVRVRSGSRSFRIERLLDDLPGADGISVRASGPQGVTCTAQGTLPGP